MKIKLDSITFDIEGDYGTFGRIAESSWTHHVGFIEVDVRGFRGVEGVPARYQTVRVKALVKTDAPQEKVDELAHLVRSPPPLEVGKTAHVRLAP
jgi:hypothetical protein